MNPALSGAVQGVRIAARKFSSAGDVRAAAALTGFADALAGFGGYYSGPEASAYLAGAALANEISLKVRSSPADRFGRS